MLTSEKAVSERLAREARIIERETTMQYIAWLNGTSVARGTEAEVERKAMAIYHSFTWQLTVTAQGKGTTLRITKGARQTVVSELELD